MHGELAWRWKSPRPRFTNSGALVKFAVPEGEVYMPIESPRGEMGYYVVSDGTAKPYRVHMRSPSFANLQSLVKMCEGRLIADVVAAIGSIDIVLGDCDR